MKKKPSKRKMLINISCLFLLGCLLIPNAGLGQNTITCKFNFTNNTTEDLRKEGAHHGEDYEIVQDLPTYLRKGNTYTMKFKVNNLDVMEKLWLIEEGALPLLDYSYTDEDANGYNLRFSVQPKLKKCMIEDHGRAYDYSFSEICHGGNKNGNPLYCVDGPSTNNGLDVSLTYGFGFVHYDKTLHQWSEVTSSSSDDTPVDPDAAYKVGNEVDIRIKYADDQSIGLSSLNEDVKVRTLETPTDSPVPQVDWKYDAATNKIFYSTTDKDYCLGIENLSKPIIVGCGGGKVKKWYFEENGLIRWDTNSGNHLCLSKNPNNTLKTSICDADNVKQKWVIEASRQALISNIRLTKNQNKCLDNKGGKIEHGNPIQLDDCKPYAPSQAWTYTKNEIRLAINQNYCLGLAGHTATSNGSPLYLYKCNHSEAQIWYYDGLRQSFRTKLKPNKCIRTTNGTEIKLWDCSDVLSSQQWFLNMAGTVKNPDQVRHIVPVMATNLAVHSHTGEEFGSNIQLWTKNQTNTAEKWHFDGMKIKINPNKNLCIEVIGTPNPTADIKLTYCNALQYTERWIYDGQTKQMRSGLWPNKCMEVAGGNYAKRGNIQLNNCNNKKKQQFLLEE